MEGERCEKEFSGLSTNVIPYSDNQLDKLSPEVWHEVKIKVGTLLDDSIPQTCKKSIADQLCQLFERLERMPAETAADLSITNVQSGMELCNVDHVIRERGENQMNEATEELNYRLRSKIAEFNEGLAHLGNKILRLKARLLSWNSRSNTETDASDLETCRNVNRNFRRILQKESRYLRDELFAARETIQRLEKRSSDDKFCIEASDSTKLIPYYDMKCRPTDFINIESGAPQLWLMSPIKSLPVTGCITTAAKLVQPRSALMKRTAPPLEIVAGPDIKSGKFICSLNGAIDTPSSSVVEWIPNQIEKLPTSGSDIDSRHKFQTEDSEKLTILT